MSAFDGLVMRARLREPCEPVEFWDGFRKEFDRLLRVPGVRLPSDHDPAVIFAGFYQIERAFSQIFQKIVGGSMPAARLRAAVWESIFTRDMRRYTRVLFDRMAPVTTLITGPSGTGKELVAQAIGRSRYLAFDARARRFAVSNYTPLNLSAFVPTLIESELFGHMKGAFVGALERKGWLEQCSGPDDTVFLDEIGELDEAIQVKLLRVLQERASSGWARRRTNRGEFQGKIITATNRDLAAAMRAGRFREDFYHRLCDDHIATPSLAEQLADPERKRQEIPELVRFLASQLLGELTPGHGGPVDDRANRPGSRRADRRGRRLDRREPGGLPVARQLPGAQPLRPQRHDSRHLPTAFPCRPRTLGRPRRGVSRHGSRRLPHEERTPWTLLRADLSPIGWQLPGRRPAPERGLARRERPSRSTVPRTSPVLGRDQWSAPRPTLLRRGGGKGNPGLSRRGDVPRLHSCGRPGPLPVKFDGNSTVLAARAD